MGACVGSRTEARSELVARVRARSGELEEAILIRIRGADAQLAGGEYPEYVAGLRTAVAAAIDHGLVGIEAGEEATKSVPTEAIAQARRAARIGVSVETVLRRYVVGSTVVGDFLMQEADSEDFAGHRSMLREALSAQARVLDGLMSAITAEHAAELERSSRSPERRRVERVRRLLAGDRCDTGELGYELSGWHLGLIASGQGAAPALSQVAASLRNRLLCVSRGEDLAWGWLEGRSEVPVEDLERALAACARGLRLAVGEPARELEGWRLTHRQAQAALRVGLLQSQPVTRYADVGLIASVLHDDELAGSFVRIYLTPLGARQDGGAVLRQTLSAYFAAERNASSAASALGVTRHTVENRLRTIEEKLGQSLRTRQAELEVALRLEELGASVEG